MEWLVCYKVLYEETADETAVYFWPSPYDKVFYASLALHDHIGKTFKVFCRLFFFCFSLSRVSTSMNGRPTYDSGMISEKALSR